MFKKMLLLLFCCFFVLITLPACQGGAESPPDPPQRFPNTDNIDPTLALKLRQDFWQFFDPGYPRNEYWKLEDIWVQYYFGNYSGCEAVYMDSAWQDNAALRGVEIAGYTIVFPSSQEVYAYYDGKFYTLKEAYDQKLITTRNVYEIGKQVDGGFLERYPKP